MVQYTVFLVVVGHTPLALLALGAGVAALTQALVGLHTHSSITAGWVTFGYITWREKRKTEVIKRQIGKVEKRHPKGQVSADLEEILWQTFCECCILLNLIHTFGKELVDLSRKYTSRYSPTRQNGPSQPGLQQHLPVGVQCPFLQCLEQAVISSSGGST